MFQMNAEASQGFSEVFLWVPEGVPGVLKVLQWRSRELQWYSRLFRGSQRGVPRNFRGFYGRS